MANRRIMLCGKIIYAWGEEGSILDKKEKAIACRYCPKSYDNIGCEYIDIYLKGESDDPTSSIL